MPLTLCLIVQGIINGTLSFYILRKLIIQRIIIIEELNFNDFTLLLQESSFKQKRNKNQIIKLLSFQILVTTYLLHNAKLA